MKTKEIGLAWIVVKDFKAAVKYYTEVLGLKLMEVSEEYGWAELEGHEGGARLGIAQASAENGIVAGTNAVITLSVDNIEKAKEEMAKKGAKFQGEIIEIPGHVKMLDGVDNDGNNFQICQKIHHHHSCCHC